MGADNNIPRHVAIIMDGNGRWALQRGLDRADGHVRGVESVREAIRSSLRHGVGYLTLYVFSKENWGRPAPEVEALMELFCKCVRRETPELIEQGTCVKIIGERQTLPPNVREDIEWIERETAGGDRLTLILALSYGSRSEITEAVRRVAAQAAAGSLDPQDITPDTVSDNLYTTGIPDPDLLIRTGGDVRLSNFMLWQAAYAELYFAPEYWPDFNAGSYDRAIGAYAGRERRYGLTTKQLQPE